jgi:hypothetical protein
MHYTPQRVVSEQWLAIRPFVTESVLDSDPANPQMARKMMSQVTHFTLWAVYTLHAPLSRRDLFVPVMIRRWVKGHAKTVSTRRTYEQTLFVVAHSLSGRDRNIRSPHSVGAVHGYSARELAELDIWAQTRRSPTDRRDAATLIGLIAGAGVWPAELLDTIRRDDITQSHDGTVTVDIRGKRPRTVVVDDEWSDYFDDILQIPEDHQHAIFRQTHTPSGARTALRRLINGPHPAPDTQRLRSTFLLRILQTTPFAEALRLTGFTHAMAFNRYLPYLTSNDTLKGSNQ